MVEVGEAGNDCTSTWRRFYWKEWLGGQYVGRSGSRKWLYKNLGKGLLQEWLGGRDIARWVRGGGRGWLYSYLDRQEILIGQVGVPGRN